MTPDTKAESFVAGTRKIVQILRYGPRELALALLGLLFLGAIPLLPKLAEMLPFLSPALPWLTGVLAVLGLLLLGFSIRRIWKKAVAPLPEGKPKPAAIKGPAPFGPQDAELFARLGRNDDLNKLRDWILDDQKPLVALMGESGVGKTSLLRAGLAHHLKDDNVPVLYWEAVPTEPEAKLLHAVRVGWEDQEKAPKSFEDLAAAVASGRRVVVIDQAEQLSPEGHPRIFELLRQVAAGDPPYRATWVVAFRREFLPVWRDFELSLPETVQRRMETLSLQRFLPKAAEKVIAVLAEEASLPVDQKVVEELVEGVAVEGKVSPVDIGISLLVLSELAGGRPDGSLSLDDFRESGGQAGLLTRYLERLLEQLPDAERPEVLRGLLSLVDLEKDQRLAEGRTLAELEESVKPASPPRFAAALRFLASGKARVLEELSAEPVRYRLVHERLIPAIRKLTGVLLAEAERASLALERGYRLWVQDRQPRFLLQSRELSEVIRFEDQIRWGKEEADKRKFVKLSWRHQLRRGLGVMAAALIVCVVVWVLIDLANRREHQSLLATWGLPKDLYGHLGRLEELTLPGTVTRLDWLYNANRLKRLTIEDGSLASLEGLPVGLEKLTIGASRLSDLTGMPASLRSLSIGPSHIKKLEALPVDLESLSISDGPSWGLGTLPQSLVSLRLEVTFDWSLNLDLRKFKNLRSFSLRVVDSALVPFEASLPVGLRSLALLGPKLTNFSQLPPGLDSLALAAPLLQPELLPMHLTHLEIVPARDESSYSLSLPDLRAAELPALQSLNLLVPADFSDLDISTLPDSVTSLRVVSAGVLRLRGLPKHIQSLNIVAESVLLDEDLPQGLSLLEIPAQVFVDDREASWQSLIGDSPSADWWDPMDLRERRLTRFPTNLISLSVIQAESRFKYLLGNNLPALATLPQMVRLRRLTLNNSGILKIPASLSRLEDLIIRGESVNELPSSLQSIVRLDIAGTSFQTLTGLPAKLKSLSLGTNQVKTLEGLPPSVTALHFHGPRGSVSPAWWWR